MQMGRTARWESRNCEAGCVLPQLYVWPYRDSGLDSAVQVVDLLNIRVDNLCKYINPDWVCYSLFYMYNDWVVLLPLAAE